MTNMSNPFLRIPGNEADLCHPEQLCYPESRPPERCSGWAIKDLCFYLKVINSILRISIARSTASLVSGLMI